MERGGNEEKFDMLHKFVLLFTAGQQHIGCLPPVNEVTLPSSLKV